MARPQTSYEVQNAEGEGVDIMLCIDVSGSMTAQDLTPNRLEAAKMVAIDFVNKRPADRIGVVSKGELILVEEKTRLMKKLGKKRLTLHLLEPMTAIPSGLGDWNLVLKAEGTVLEYNFDAAEEGTGIPALLRRLSELGIGFKDLQTEQSSLEDIFVSLVHDGA